MSDDALEKGAFIDLFKTLKLKTLFVFCLFEKCCRRMFLFILSFLIFSFFFRTLSLFNFQLIFQLWALGFLKI